jgi:hypothetical protein
MSLSQPLATLRILQLTSQRTHLAPTFDDIEMRPGAADTGLPSLEDAQQLLAALEEPRNVPSEVRDALHQWRSWAEQGQETRVNDDEHVMDTTGPEEDGKAFEFDYMENDVSENPDAAPVTEPDSEALRVSDEELERLLAAFCEFCS